MSSSNVGMETQSSASPEEMQRAEQATPHQTKTVTKQKDPRRVSMGRQLGLRSQELKLKKRELMESGKQHLQQLAEQAETDSGSRTQMIAVSGVFAALAFGYLIYTNTRTKHCCPPSSPPDGYEKQQQAEQVKVSQPVSTPHKPLLPLIETTDVVNME